MSEIRLITDTDAVASVYDLSSAAHPVLAAAPGGQGVYDAVVLPSHGYMVLDLEPGRYLVQAVLSSGKVLNQQFTVAPSAPPTRVVLGRYDGPHEWMEWQRGAGNVEGVHAYSQSYSARQYQSPFEAMTAPAASVVSVGTPVAPGPADLAAPEALAARGFFFALPGAKEWSPAKPLDGLLPAGLPGVAASGGPVLPNQQDGLSYMYFCSQESVAAAAGRHYLFVAGKGVPAQYCVLPVAGLDAEVLVRSDVARGAWTGADEGHRLSIAVRHEVLNPVLGYLGAGQLPAAAALVDRSLDLLFGKLGNPLAAAAGAYVLLGTQEVGQGKAWQDWVENLMNWFTWLPDGAIQRAWVLLRGGAGAGCAADARACLLEGYRRGLPFYSRGVRLLLDGLTLFANDAREAGQPDDEVEAARSAVWQLALRVNTRQPFTAVLLG
jgi:hypothetical protein